jgi:hypothetical protein
VKDLVLTQLATTDLKRYTLLKLVLHLKVGMYKNDPEDKKPSFDDIRTVTHLKERADEIVKTKQTEFIKFLEEWR